MMFKCGINVLLLCPVTWVPWTLKYVEMLGSKMNNVMIFCYSYKEHAVNLLSIKFLLVLLLCCYYMQ